MLLLTILKNIDMYVFKLWFWLHCGPIYFGKMQANTVDVAATAVAETSKIVILWQKLQLQTAI